MLTVSVAIPSLRQCHRLLIILKNYVFIPPSNGFGVHWIGTFSSQSLSTCGECINDIAIISYFQTHALWGHRVKAGKAREALSLVRGGNDQKILISLELYLSVKDARSVAFN
uniref:Uncharacterized protein n=1 Tax=Anguilla anguilla TaxID=7936 RepID=A0A0E9Q8S7_ANGAN